MDFIIVIILDKRIIRLAPQQLFFPNGFIKFYVLPSTPFQVIFAFTFLCEIAFYKPPAF